MSVQHFDAFPTLNRPKADGTNHESRKQVRKAEVISAGMAIAMLTSDSPIIRSTREQVSPFSTSSRFVHFRERSHGLGMTSERLLQFVSFVQSDQIVGST